MDDLKQLLEKPIAFSPALARVFGGVNEALYIQQIIYWSDKAKRTDGYIFKTKEDIEAETTLTRFQQDKVRKKLEKMGVLKTKLIKAYGAPTLHYKVDFRLVRNLLMEKRETYYSNSKKLTKPVTENTTENTTLLLRNREITPQYGNADINKIMDCFEESFGMKPSRLKENRRAAQRILLKVKDADKVCRVIKYAASIQGEKYSPSIGNVLDIEEKLIKLVAHSRSATERVYDAG